MRTETGMATQILDTQSWPGSSPLIAIALCERGQVWVSASPCIKWNCNYPPCKILVRPRYIQVPRKVLGTEDNLLNVTTLMMMNMVVVVLVMIMIMLTKMLVVILFIFSNLSTDNHDYYHLRERKNDSSSFKSSQWGLDSSTPGYLESPQSRAGAVWMPSQGLIPLTWSRSPCIQIQVILPSSYWCSCNCSQIVPLAFLGGSSL